MSPAEIVVLVAIVAGVAFLIWAIVANARRDPEGTRTLALQEQQPDPARVVYVRDFDMPFLSMVGFMVKWAIASIPALIILFVLMAAGLIALGSLGYVFSGGR